MLFRLDLAPPTSPYSEVLEISSQVHGGSEPYFSLRTGRRRMLAAWRKRGAAVKVSRGFYYHHSNPPLPMDGIPGA